MNAEPHREDPGPAAMAAGIVLCGGLSRRMGRPKALLPWRGRPLVAHVCEVLATVVEEVVVVSSSELRLPRLPARIVVDREPRLGPLAGIRDGLSAIDSDLAYVTSTDAPFLTGSFIEFVLSHGRTAAPVVDGYVQPLAAAYERAGAEVADRLLARDQRRPLFLLEELGYRPLTEGELPSRDPLRNLNTPESYLQALRGEGGAESRGVEVEFLGTSRARAGSERLQVGVGTLGQVLAEVERRSGLRLLTPRAGGSAGAPAHEVVSEYLVSLAGGTFLRETSVPIGPGERLLVIDAAVGG